MKNIFRITSLLLVLLFTNCATGKNEVAPLELLYEKPATRWEQALPIGNGRLGAMIFGGVGEEHIQFNEETLWTGGPHDYAHKGASEYLNEIRQLLWNGKQGKAEKLASKRFMSVPLTQQKYQPFGDVHIKFEGHENAVNYKRSLNISDAVANVAYEIDENNYSREYIASTPDQVIAIKYKSKEKGKLSFEVNFSSEHEDQAVKFVDENTLVLDVQVKDGALRGTSMLKVVTEGGETLHNGGVVTVSGANEATLYLVAATNFISPIDVSGDSNLKCMTYLEQIKGKNYAEIKKEHVLDYKKYFERFSIDLGVSGKENMPTDDRIINIMSEMDNSLAALYVQYSRYLMLSSSRPGTYPANLQGIWNHKLAPPWDSKYTVNINTEMNYWPVEPLNISECHSALFKMLEEVVPSGRVVAKEHYDARGWVLHHNTDIWRGAAPINASNHGIWVTGGAWLSQHFWEHYLYSGDKKFLEEQAWPILKESALFFTDFLVEDPKTGWLVSVPSNSPENGGLVSGPTMDHQIIRGLFRACIECSEILGEEKEFASELKEMLPRIAPNQIGQHGQLQEWVVDNDSPRNKHRHVSHLWGVYPGKEINWNDSPELMKAARQSLLFRGDEGTGWSLAWKINFWSRFRDGNHAWQMVRMLLSPALHPDRDVRGGSYPNLFDAHPPFQIDGNFGGAAGIVEMLIQSHLNEIELLPALPDDVPDGSIKGVRSRGGFELDFAWKEKKIIEVKVVSSAGNMLRLRYGDKIVEIKTQKGEELEFDGDLIRL